MKYFTEINLNGNELKRATIENSDTEPLSPKEGQIYYDTTSKSVKVFNGTGWSTIAGNSSYLDLTNKPSIEMQPLEGSLMLEDIGLHFLTNEELDLLLK